MNNALNKIVPDYLPKKIRGPTRPTALPYLYSLIVEGWEGAYDFSLSHSENYDDDAFDKIVVSAIPAAIAACRQMHGRNEDDPNGKDHYHLDWSGMVHTLVEVLVRDHGFRHHSILTDTVCFELEDHYPFVDEAEGYEFDPAVPTFTSLHIQKGPEQGLEEAPKLAAEKLKGMIE